MVLFWCRTKQGQLRALSNQFKRHYFQIHTPSSIIRETKIGAVNGQSLTFHKTRFEPANCVRFFAAPVQVKAKYDEKNNGPRMNEQISAQFVRLVTDEGHSVVSRHEALDRARRLNVDLVEVQPDGKPPVCKLMDYKKEMYVKQVKEKEQTKKKSDLVLRKGAMKEVRITCKIDKHDLQTKAEAVKRLAERGHRIKCMAVAVGTENQDLGGLLSRFSALIEEFSLVESGPKVEAKQAYVVVRHIKFGPLKKGPSKKKLLEMSNNNTSTESPEIDQDEPDSEDETAPEEAMESDSPNEFDHDRMVKQTSNRYALKQTNGSIPVSDSNRYANMKPANGSAPGVRRRFEPESQSQSQSQNPGSNRQFDSNRRGPASGYGMFGAPKPDNGPEREVNRYKKGPGPQQQQPPSSDYNRDQRGDYSREKQGGFKR